MADLNPIHWWRQLRDLPNSSPSKALAMAVIVSVTCALMVSATAVWLRPLQQANLDAARQARMQEMVASLPGLGTLIAEAGGDSLEARLVDLETGTFVEGDALGYDVAVRAEDPETSIELSADADLAGLQRRARQAPIFLLEADGRLALLVLPVYGQGYQSVLRGYLALNGDLDEIAGLTFYEQGETPGLGARIQDASWEALWPGTALADETGKIAVAVARGTAVAAYEVDGITGATRTGNGVTNLLQFWLGEYGYGPLLERLKAEGAGS